MCFFSLTVEQEQIQKKTFTNWVNAQLAKVSCVSELWPHGTEGDLLLLAVVDKTINTTSTEHL